MTAAGCEARDNGCRSVPGPTRSPLSRSRGGRRNGWAAPDSSEVLAPRNRADDPGFCMQLLSLVDMTDGPVICRRLFAFVDLGLDDAGDFPWRHLTAGNITFTKSGDRTGDWQTRRRRRSLGDCLRVGDGAEHRSTCRHRHAVTALHGGRQSATKAALKTQVLHPGVAEPPPDYLTAHSGIQRVAQAIADEREGEHGHRNRH